MPNVFPSLALLRFELTGRGAHGMRAQFDKLVHDEDWERATMLALAVAMKVRGEPESCAFVVALGSFAVAVARKDDG